MPTNPDALFGAPAALYDNQQFNDATVRAAQFARMDPSERGAYGMFMGGSQVGNVLQGALGAQDPMRNLVAARQSIMSEIDPSDPASFRGAAQKLLHAGDYQGAQHLVKTSRELEVSMADALHKRAEATKALSDRGTNDTKNAQALADASGFERGTPEYVKAYKDALTSLTTAKEAKATVIGVAEGTREAVFSDGNSQFTIKNGSDGKQVKVPFEGRVDRMTSSVKVNAKGGDVIEEDAYSKEAGKNYADLEKEALVSARTSAKAMRNLSIMNEKNARGIYSGPQAQMTKDASNFLESLGLLSKEQTAKLTNSTEYDKMAKDLVMNDLGGKLGAQVSDADRAFVEARIPQLTTNPQARTELIAKLKEIHGKNIKYYQKMQGHLKANRSLKGFDFANADELVPTEAAPTAQADPLGLRGN